MRGRCDRLCNSGAGWRVCRAADLWGRCSSASSAKRQCGGGGANFCEYFISPIIVEARRPPKG